jgi:hypothetical protein
MLKTTRDLSYWTAFTIWKYKFSAPQKNPDGTFRSFQMNRWGIRSNFVVFPIFFRHFRSHSYHACVTNISCHGQSKTFLYYILITYWPRVSAVRENIQPRSCCIDRAISRSVQQDRGWIFSRTARTVEVSKF